MPLPTPLATIGDKPAPHAIRWVARGGDDAPYQWDFETGEHFRQEDATRWICQIAAAHGWPVTIRIVALAGEKAGTVLADSIIWTADAHLERGSIPKMPPASSSTSAAAGDGTAAMFNRIWELLTSDLEMTRALVKTIREGWDALAPSTPADRIAAASSSADANGDAETGAPAPPDVRVRVEFLHSNVEDALPGLALWAHEVGVELEELEGHIWATGPRSRIVAGAHAMDEFGWDVGTVIWLDREPPELEDAAAAGASDASGAGGMRNVS